jgi:predicted DCC family thiol-disulfide oxidoreductase YuxK
MRARWLNVVYDGQCGFCIRSLRVCKAADVRHRLRFHDANQRAEIASAFPELAGADFENAMFTVAGDRRVDRGFFAFRRIALTASLLWPLLPLLYFPGSALVGPKVYAWVARNRSRFGCESEACEMPAAKRSRPLL